ncbi:uncharacterized protein LOC134927837 isoform X46 [Pseudophryne corroboree]|uniref:uncharacterized protein LOC134927837 isoform X46 n=1 Tax=Pseudophryne corroboree TaxID=495146 RepID=UPI0030819B75
MMYGQIVPRGSTENTQNIQNASLTNEDPEAKRSRFSCPGCNFACNSLQNYKIHLHQTNHEDVEKVMTQNPSALNKPENQKMNTTKNTENQNVNTTRIPGNQMNTTRIPENQRMNTSEVPDNQKMNTARIPGIQMMNTTRVPGNQMMNTTNVPGNQMNTTRFQGNQMNTTRFQDNQKININMVPGNQMNTTRIPENQKMDTIRVQENQKMNTPRTPEVQMIYTTRIPETKKMDATKNPDDQKINSIKTPGTLAEHIGSSIFFLKDYMHRTDREPLIGLQYVLEYKVRTKANRIEPRYVCELCNLKTDVVPMVEHLAGFKHRKLYLTKEYPYVLKAPDSKESWSQFVRRMALEIEREEGSKMYKVDNTVRMESKTPAKQPNRKTRWDIEGNQSQRMNKALEYLESFEIDNDSEAMTATGLSSKLTADLKLCSERKKEGALFPVRDARAKDVAMSQMQNVSGERRTFQNPVQQNPMLNMPPQFNRGPPETNTMQDGLRGPNMHRIDQTKMTPNASVPQKPQQFPFGPSNRTHNIQNLSVPNTTGSAQKYETAQSNQNDQSTGDLQFMNKLKELIHYLPQNTSSTENVPMNPKLMMIKSLLLDQTPSSNLSQQVAALTQDIGNTDKGSLNQQLMLRTSHNSTTMENVLLAKNTLSVENPQRNQTSLMQMAGGMQDPQYTGNVPMNKNLMSNLNQSVPNQQGGQVGSSSMMQMNQDAYQKQNLYTQPEYAGASQNYGNFGYDRSVEGNYLSQAEPYVSRYDDIVESGIHRANEQTRTPYSEMSYESGMHGRKWNEPSYRSPSAQVAGTSRERAPYTRVSLSPNYMAPASNTHEMYNLKPFDLPEWGDRESDILHSKRARLDMDHIPQHYSEDYYRESHQPYGMHTAGLSEDIKDRLRGKDSFTVSAILSEYADSRPSN